MFGFKVVSQEQPREIVRLGNKERAGGRSITEGLAGIVDHFAIGIPAFNRAAVEGHLKQRGADTAAGRLCRACTSRIPNGINVQIIRSGSEGSGLSLS